LVKAKYAAHAVDGEGARLYGTRWTSSGRLAFMTSQTRSLAMLEVLVNLPARRFLSAYVSLRVEIPEEVVETLGANALPADWHHSPVPPSTRAIGDRWMMAGISAVLRVPSAVVPEESNYLVNPRHRDFGRLRVFDPAPVTIDARL